MIVSTKKNETLSSLKRCKKCGSAPIVSRKYDLFYSPGDLYTVIFCPTCKSAVQALTDESAALGWNSHNKEESDDVRT